MSSFPSISTTTVADVHASTTLFHVFIYFAPEAAEAYEALGLSGRAGYFASRTAAMGALSPEMIVATFYNFSPDVVLPLTAGVWDQTTPAAMQAARWRAAARVLERHVAPVSTAADVTEAIQICTDAIAELQWAGRPLAAGNAAVVSDLDTEEFAGNDLLRLWQLVTVLREWRGDAHIGLLVAEPLDGAECTVVSSAISKLGPDVLRRTRGWSDADWSAATERLADRGWADADGTLTDHGRAARAVIEDRTNELSAALWTGAGEQAANRLDEIVKPMNEALRAGGYFKPLGLPPRND